MQTSTTLTRALSYLSGKPAKFAAIAVAGFIGMTMTPSDANAFQCRHGARGGGCINSFGGIGFDRHGIVAGDRHGGVVIGRNGAMFVDRGNVYAYKRGSNCYWHNGQQICR